MLRSVFLLLCVVTLGYVYAAPANHGLSSTFTQEDVATLKKFLQSQPESNIHDAFFATQALALLDTKPTAAKQTELCTLAKNTLKDKAVVEKQDVKSIYHAAALVQVLKCDGVTLDKAAIDALKSTIDEGASVPNYYYAVSAALSLRAQTKKDISDDELTSVVAKLGDLTESDGTVRSTTDDKDGSLYNTGLVLQIYARLLTEGKLSEQDKEHVDELVSKVETILELANEGDNSLYFTSGNVQPTLETTAEVVRGLTSLSKALKKPLDVTPNQLAQIGNYFLSHNYFTTLEDGYYLLVGLRAVQQSDKSPLALIAERSSISSTAKGSEGEIKLRLTDIFDHPINGKVTLVKSHPLGKPDNILLANHEVKDNTLAFLAVKPDQGFYNLEYRAVPSDTVKYATIDSASRRVKIIGSVSVSDLEVLVSDSREARSEGSTYKAEFPKAIEEPIQAVVGQFIHVQFKIRNAGGASTRPLTAQQAFVRFVHAKSGHEAVFVATPNDIKAYSAVISIDESARSQFNQLSGDYTVSVVVGDAFIQNPISWTVSKALNIQFAEKSSSASQSSSSNLAAKPVIAHKFREAEKRAHAFTSTVFVGLTFAPFLILFGGFIALGANIGKFPTDSDFFSAVAFVVTIGLNLALIALYWFALNLVQTLTYLAVLAVPTVFFGNRALSALARKEK